jgi:hypothetical protein
MDQRESAEIDGLRTSLATLRGRVWQRRSLGRIERREILQELAERC